MSVAEQLERLARLIPGVGGYQDKESSRDTDKTIRTRLAEDLEQLKRDLEEEKRYFMELSDIMPLSRLDRITSKLDKLGNMITYAARGYRGFFDTYTHDQQKLNQIYSFDLGLFDDLSAMKIHVNKVHDAHSDVAAFKIATARLDQLCNQFERKFSERHDLLLTE